jgi:hypothetical protein
MDGDGTRPGRQQRHRPAEPPGQGGNQDAVEHHQDREGNHRDPARADQVEVGVATAQRLKSRAGNDQRRAP